MYNGYKIHILLFTMLVLLIVKLLMDILYLTLKKKHNTYTKHFNF